MPKANQYLYVESQTRISKVRAGQTDEETYTKTMDIKILLQTLERSKHIMITKQEEHRIKSKSVRPVETRRSFPQGDRKPEVGMTTVPIRFMGFWKCKSKRKRHIFVECCLDTEMERCRQERQSQGLKEQFCSDIIHAKVGDTFRVDVTDTTKQTYQIHFIGRNVVLKINLEHLLNNAAIIDIYKQQRKLCHFSIQFDHEREYRRNSETYQDGSEGDIKPQEGKDTVPIRFIGFLKGKSKGQCIIFVECCLDTQLETRRQERHSQGCEEQFCSEIIHSKISDTRVDFTEKTNRELEKHFVVGINKTIKFNPGTFWKNGEVIDINIHQHEIYHFNIQIVQRRDLKRNSAIDASDRCRNAGMDNVISAEEKTNTVRNNRDGENDIATLAKHHTGSKLQPDYTETGRKIHLICFVKPLHHIKCIVTECCLSCKTVERRQFWRQAGFIECGNPKEYELQSAKVVFVIIFETILASNQNSRNVDYLFFDKDPAVLVRLYPIETNIAINVINDDTIIAQFELSQTKDDCCSKSDRVEGKQLLMFGHKVSEVQIRVNTHSYPEKPTPDNSSSKRRTSEFFVEIQLSWVLKGFPDVLALQVSSRTDAISIIRSVCCQNPEGQFAFSEAKLSIFGHTPYQCMSIDSIRTNFYLYQRGIRYTIPDRLQLDKLCERRGRKSHECLYFCQRICFCIASTSCAISDVYAAYRPDSPSRVVFVVTVEDLDIVVACKKKRILGYEVQLASECNQSKGQETVFEKACIGPEDQVRVKQCISKYGSQLMKEHRKLGIITARSTRRKTCGRNMCLLIRQTCIVLYVHAKGYIPIEEEAFETQYGGIAIDVRSGAFRLLNDTKLQMGSLIHRPEAGIAGTLGGFVDHPKHGLCCISCAHCLLTNTEFNYLKERKEVSPEGRLNPVYQKNSLMPIGNLVEIFYTEVDNIAGQVGVEIALMKIDDIHHVDGSFVLQAPDFKFETGIVATESMMPYIGECFKVCWKDQLMWVHLR
ncbi:uncharacterized protein LOC128214410 isoform X2 [Mya arenaria]|uniref:uncharacterized protein LOC128214410 isoform X2 n=1 Tax=Mya arenaria TaxID=6604 RepID=UPI0022E91FAB|nr:uncharacterized protein LOC128214410 isoform X2 [Mya arenaria]